MSLTPSSPEVWEQALVNGRTVFPGSDEDAIAWAKDWYAEQGCTFSGEVKEVLPAPDAEVEAQPEVEAVETADAEPEEEVKAEEVAPVAPAARRTRTRRTDRQD